MGGGGMGDDASDGLTGKVIDDGLQVLQQLWENFRSVHHRVEAGKASTGQLVKRCKKMGLFVRGTFLISAHYQS